MVVEEIIYGSLTAAVVGWGLLAIPRDRGLAAAASVVLALGWGGCRLAERVYGYEFSPDAYALVDITSCFLVALLYARTEARWVAALAFVFTTQAALHLIYQAEWKSPGGIYAYLTLLNTLYALALGLVAYGGRGAADVLADLGRMLLSRLRRVGAAQGSVQPGFGVSRRQLDSRSDRHANGGRGRRAVPVNGGRD